MRWFEPAKQQGSNPLSTTSKHRYGCPKINRIVLRCFLIISTSWVSTPSAYALCSWSESLDGSTTLVTTHRWSRLFPWPFRYPRCRCHCIARPKSSPLGPSEPLRPLAVPLCCRVVGPTCRNWTRWAHTLIDGDTYFILCKRLKEKYSSTWSGVYVDSCRPVHVFMQVLMHACRQTCEHSKVVSVHMFNHTCKHAMSCGVQRIC